MRMLVGATRHLEDRAIVVIEQCWGCNRLRGPKWAEGWLPVLNAEGRLRFREYICDNGPTGVCLQALMIMDPNNKAIPKTGKKGTRSGARKRTHAGRSQ